MPQIVIVDRKAVLNLSPGHSLMETMDMGGVNIMHACGGNCICGTCNVEILEGLENIAPPAEAERMVLSKIKRKGPNVRLSCQCFPTGDIKLSISLTQPIA